MPKPTMAAPVADSTAIEKQVENPLEHLSSSESLRRHTAAITTAEIAA